MQGKENAACGLIIKWKFIFQKRALWTANGHTPLGLIHFWGQLWGALFSGSNEREMLHVAC